MDVNVLGNVGKELCQNSPLAKTPTKEIEIEKIVEEYMKNDLTEAIVFGGLEWMDQFLELIVRIEAFRKKTLDDIVIYTRVLQRRNRRTFDDFEKVQKYYCKIWEIHSKSKNTL